MSAALIKKGLEIVDPEYTSKSTKKKNKSIFDLIPPNLQLKGNKLATNSQKYTVTEAKKQIKSKDTVIKENLKKLELIRTSTKITLDRETRRNIIERAVTKRPVKSNKKSKKNKKTVFTEEDFKKFEEEYLADA